MLSAKCRPYFLGLNVLTHWVLVTPYGDIGSTLAQVMACCLRAPSHYLNQCWLITSMVQWHFFKGYFIRNTSTINYENELEMHLSKIPFKSPRGQWVNWCWHLDIPRWQGQYYGWWCPGGWFNVKMASYQYRKSHCGDKTILRPSYLHNGISYTGKMPSLYWIRALVPCIARVISSNHGIEYSGWLGSHLPKRKEFSRVISVLRYHYSDVIMSVMASQITGVLIVYSIVCSGAGQRKHQSSTSLVFVKGIHRWLVNSLHEEPVTHRLFPFDHQLL